MKQLGKPARIWLALALTAACILLLAAPMFLSDFRLNLLAKFLSFALLAVGLDLAWGYTGILSLGQGVFFGLGAYCMALYLKLEASHGQLPDFMQWSGLGKLPWFWVPFHHLWYALLMSILLPMILAGLLGYITFRNRVRGVYFTILTQALVLIVVTLFIGQQAYTGGTNGVTGFSTLLGYNLKDPSVKTVLYVMTVMALVAAVIFARWLAGTRLATVLQAIRDGENRVRFLGFNPAMYKTFIFSVAAGLSGLSGVCFVLHVGIISPSMMDIVPSIEMVLWVAIGGRGSVYGAVIGALLLNYAKSSFSDAYPDIWSYFLGGLFVVSVVFLPQGFVGLMSKGLSWMKEKVIRVENTEYHSVLGESKH